MAITKVHSAKTNIATINATMVTTRSNTTNSAKTGIHAVEHPKPISINHWERLRNVRKNLQEELEIPPNNPNVKKILDDTNVTIVVFTLIE